MSKRGLPGFLRRCRRGDYFDDDYDEEEEVAGVPVAEEEEEGEAGSQQQQQEADNKNSNNNDSNNDNDTNDSANDNDNDNDNDNATDDSQKKFQKQQSLLATKNDGLRDNGDDDYEAQDKVASLENTNRDFQSMPFGDLLKNDKEEEKETDAKQTQQQQQQQRMHASVPTMTTSSSSSNNNNNNNNNKQPAFSYRDAQFHKVINSDVVQLSELRKLAWNGIPPEFRGMAWKLMLGYLPTNRSRRKHTLERKRAEYKDAMASQHYNIDDNSRSLSEQETLRQVLVDVPRTAPEIPLFRNERIKRCLSRLLYIWAMRHPASSYVQGINDLTTPLFAVFLSEYYSGEDCLDGNVMEVISDERLEEVEADVYWCLTNILAGIQDHYTADQPGVQRMVMRLEELVQRIDGNLCGHFANTGIQFMQFAYKWMNCLLLREFHLNCIIRLWDTYIAESNNNTSISTMMSNSLTSIGGNNTTSLTKVGGKAGFEDFHVYVCAAFLCQFSSQLQDMDFEMLFAFMQNPPTEDWTQTEIEMLLSQAYVLSTLFEGSEAHLNR